MTVENGKTFEDFFPSRWLKAADIPDENAIFTILDVSAERIEVSTYVQRNYQALGFE